MTIEIIEGDSREVLKEFADNSIDSVVTDPPYALVSISKRFGKDDAAPAKAGKTGAYQRASAGFMGKTWDTGETAFDPAFWADVLRVLKPGGHVLAFGGTRTYHRLACAIEDAGFEIRDQIGWLYGSGFPKSHNQHDEWQGWGTALKPAWEPIVVARKSLLGTVAGNLALWGVGALNIDACRVAPSEGDDPRLGGNGSWTTTKQQSGDTVSLPRGEVASSPLGRWPGNVIHDGSEEVLAALGDPSRFFYCSKASKSDRNDGLPNTHPTVKPTDLMRYLCRLVTPPGGTVLDPFMGSGSTGRGAVLEGFSFIGIEMDPSYFDIADARIAAAEAAAAPKVEAAE